MIFQRLLLIAALSILPAASSTRGAMMSQAQSGTPARKLTFSTPAQMQEDIKEVPCKGNTERLAGVKALFMKMGAAASDISVEKINNVENVVVRKQGSTPELVVIGAHYDKVSHGCGAVDNWTGVVTIAHIYRTIKDMSLKKNVLFVAFGREEEGLIGSREMVKAIGKDQLTQYCAMINLDSLGLGIPQAETGISSKKLVARAEELAKRMQMPFQKGTIREGDTDSSSFLERKIPAIALHGLSNEWERVLHTHDDKVSKVNPMSVFMGYRLALGLLGEVETSACDAFR